MKERGLFHQDIDWMYGTRGINRELLTVLRGIPREYDHPYTQFPGMQHPYRDILTRYTITPMKMNRGFPPDKLPWGIQVEDVDFYQEPLIVAVEGNQYHQKVYFQKRYDQQFGPIIPDSLLAMGVEFFEANMMSLEAMAIALTETRERWPVLGTIERE